MSGRGPAGRAAELAAVVPGWILSVAAGVTGLVRPASKPLHPAGTLYPATMHRLGLRDGGRVGVAWLDDPGTTEGVVRFSRAIGLPEAVPDIHGLALRMTGDDGRPADVLMATTGLGRITRFVLTATRTRGGKAYSTLLPYRSPNGPILLAATSQDPDATRFVLSVASPAGPWQQFAELLITEPHDEGSGDEMSFDPTLNMLDGLAYYSWETRLREGAYSVARWTRRVRG